MTALSLLTNSLCLEKKHLHKINNYYNSVSFILYTYRTKAQIVSVFTKGPACYGSSLQPLRHLYQSSNLTQHQIQVSGLSCVQNVKVKSIQLSIPYTSLKRRGTIANKSDVARSNATDCCQGKTMETQAGVT